MSTSDKNNLITVVVLEPLAEGAETLAKAIESNPNCEVLRLNSPQEAVQVAIQSQPCLIVTCFISQETITNSVILLKSIFNLTKRGRVKPVVVSKIKAPQLRTMAQKLMVSEFMEEPIPARTIQFKANIQIKAVEAIKKKDAELLAREQTIELKKGEAVKANQEDYSGARSLKKELGRKEDAFTFKGSKVRKKGNQTAFNLGGPDPASGEWVEHESEEEGKTAWRWVPNDENEKKEAGGKDGKDGWIAEGEKPVFDEQKKKWDFSAEKPRLYLRKDGKKVAEKVTTNKDGELEVAKDSEEAEKKVAAALEKIKSRQESDSKTKEKKDKSGDTEESAPKAIGNKIKAEDDKAGAKDRLKALGDDDDEDSSDSKKDVSEKKNTDNEKEANKKGFSIGEQIGKSKENGSAPNNKIGEEEDDDSKKKKEQKLKSKPKSLRDRLLDGDEEELEEDEKNANELVDRRTNDQDSSPELKDKRANDEIADEKSKKRSKLKQRPRTKDEDDSDEVKSEDELVGTALKDKRTGNDETDKKGLRNRLLDGDDAEGSQSSNDKQKSPSDFADGAIEKSGFDVDEQLGASERADKLKKLKKKLVDQAREEAEKPIKKKLTPEEREQMKRDLRENSDSLSDEELGKRHKKEKIRKLMKQMKELDQEAERSAEEKAGSKTNIHDLKKDPIESTQSQSTSSPLADENKWDARDSDQEDSEVDWKGHKSAAAFADSKIKKKKSEKDAHYLSDAELNVDGPAWEKTESFYVCIAAATKYRGFTEIEDLLPIWIFLGDDKPEFLEKDSRWRFYFAPPSRIEQIDKIPYEVRDYLENLNNQIRSAVEKDPKIKEQSESVEAAEKETAAMEDKLAALRDRLNEEIEPTPEEAEVDGFDLGEYKKNKKAQVENDLNEIADELNKAREELSRKKEALALMFADNRESESNQESKNDQDPEKSETPAEPQSMAAQLEEKVSSPEAIAFLNKRKKREKRVDGDNKVVGMRHEALAKERADSLIGTKVTPKSEAGDIIGIELLLSDAVFDGKNIIREPKGLLQAICDRFGNVNVKLIEATDENSGKVIQASEPTVTSGDLWSYRENIVQETRDYVTAKLKNPKNQSILGFIEITPLMPRTDFLASDVVLLEKIAASIALYWSAKPAPKAKVAA